MMKKSIQIIGSIISIIIGFIIIVYIAQQYYCYKAEPILITTACPKKRPIAHIVEASGDLEIKHPVMLGSIVSGIVRELLVKENESVTAGQLLMTIDPGTGDTDFEQAYNVFLRTQQEYLYLKNNFIRKTALYKAQQLSQDEYELIEKNMRVAEYTFKAAKANLNREKLLLNERNIYAPQDGFITKINVSKGSGVTGSNVQTSTPLIEIAPDFSCMEVKLNVDEGDISSICIGQKITLTVNAYPDQPITSIVRDIGFSPKKIDGVQFYKVSADIHNPEKRFRPGMLFNAKIHIAEKEQALCLHGFAFQINPKSIKRIAKKINCACSSLTKQEQQALKHNKPDKRIKFIWVKQGNSIIQKPVVVGIADNTYFEICEGLSETDEVITDVSEQHLINTVYKRWFSGPF